MCRVGKEDFYLRPQIGGFYETLLLDWTEDLWNIHGDGYFFDNCMSDGEAMAKADDYIRRTNKWIQKPKNYCEDMLLTNSWGKSWLMGFVEIFEHTHVHFYCKTIEEARELYKEAALNLVTGIKTFSINDTE
jgi:hypothetical protein